MLKEIKIFSYGELKDVNYQFNKGINKIIKDNEKGKTTLINAIRDLYFGFSVKFLEKHAYAPWDGSNIRIEGTFICNGSEIILERELSKKAIGILKMNSKKQNIGNIALDFVKVSKQNFNNLYAITEEEINIISLKSWDDVLDNLVKNYGDNRFNTPKDTINLLIKKKDEILRDSKRGNYKIKELDSQISTLRKELNDNEIKENELNSYKILKKRLLLKERELLDKKNDVELELNFAKKYYDKKLKYLELDKEANRYGIELKNVFEIETYLKKCYELNRDIVKLKDELKNLKIQNFNKKVPKLKFNEDFIYKILDKINVYNAKKEIHKNEHIVFEKKRELILKLEKELFKNELNDELRKRILDFNFDKYMYIENSAKDRLFKLELINLFFFIILIFLSIKGNILFLTFIPIVIVYFLNFFKKSFFIEAKKYRAKLNELPIDKFYIKNFNFSYFDRIKNYILEFENYVEHKELLKNLKLELKNIESYLIENLDWDIENEKELELRILRFKDEVNEFKNNKLEKEKIESEKSILKNKIEMILLDIENKEREFYSYENKINLNDKYDINELLLNLENITELKIKYLSLNYEIDDITDIIDNKIKDNIIDLETSFKNISNELEMIKKELITLTEKINSFESFRLLKEVKEELNEKVNYKKELLYRRDILELSINMVKKYDLEYKMINQPDIILKAKEYFSYITNNRYSEIFMDINDTREVFIKTNYGDKSLGEMFSKATKEQLYFSLRLSIIKRMSDENVPLVLDEIFANWDNNRYLRAIKILEKEFSNKCIILLTCRG